MSAMHDDAVFLHVLRCYRATPNRTLDVLAFARMKTGWSMRRIDATLRRLQLVTPTGQLREGWLAAAIGREGV